MLLLASANAQAAGWREPPANPLAFYPAAAAWTGSELVTAAVGLNGNLYAYEQLPGQGWTMQLVETEAKNGGKAFMNPSIVSTGSTVQIVAADKADRIQFWQQDDGQKTWSAPELVGTLSVDDITSPEIAWTGVPGHTGTNSVITVANNAGDVLFFWQDGSRWQLETVADGTASNEYFKPVLTATDKGIVIVAPGEDGALFSWFQPYGGSKWISDGSLGAPAGASYGYVSIAWDGTHADVAASYDDGSGGGSSDQLRFLWKGDSASTWSHIVISGVSSSHVLDSGPAIYFTGTNVILAAAVNLSSSSSRLDYWYQTASFQTFGGPQTVSTATSPAEFWTPALVSTTGAKPQVAIFAPESPDQVNFGLYDWTQPVGTSDPWVMHTIVNP